MKLKLALAKTNDRANALAISNIKKMLSLGERVFVVVPDRASLITELNIIKNINGKGVLGLQVLTLNTLIDKFDIVKRKTLSTYGAQLLIKKIVNNHKNEINCFNKMASNFNFIVELYKTIQQLKSSTLCVDEISNSLTKMPTGLKLKMEDILLVWKEYEKEIKQNFSDDFSKIYGFINDVKLNSEIKNSNFVFLNFSCATSLAIQVCFELIKFAKEVVVALPYCKNSDLNSNIFDDFVYKKIVNFAEDNNYFIEKEFDNNQNLLEEKLLAFDIAKSKNKPENLELFVSNNEDEEIKNVSGYILKSVFEGKDFNDFNVIVCDCENYLDKIKSNFKANKIPFFIDEQFGINNHSLIKFIKSIIECLKYNFKSENVLGLVKNFYFGKDYFKICDFENYVFKFGIEEAMFFADFKDENANDVRLALLPLINSYKQFKKCKSANEFLEILNCILQEFDINKKTDELMKKLNDKNDLENAKITQQILEKTNEVFNDISSVLNDSICTENEFKDFLFAGFDSKKISLVPVSSGCVYVGDLNSSFFENDKINIVVGANNKSFPAYVFDCGLISDTELKEFDFNEKLSPTIKQINQRSLYKAFEVCCSGKKLVLSFAKVVGGEERSESLLIVDVSKNIYDEKIKDFESFDWQNLQKTSILSRAQATNFFCEQIKRMIDGKKVVDKTLVSTLSKLFDFNLNKFQKQDDFVQLENFSNEIAITKIEKYFACPFKNFLTNFVKVKERESKLIKAVDIGNIYHEFVYCFVKKIKCINDSNLKQKCLDIFDDILLSKKFQEITEVIKNKIIINSLKKEIVKIGKSLLCLENSGNFKAFKLEESFGAGENLASPVLKTKNKIYSIKGKIDRVDVCNNFVRVIDYKTGSSKFKFNETFFGKKIQLVSYLLCLKENGFAPAGAYYFPISAKFNKNNSLLDGITKKDLSLIKDYDFALKPTEKSSIINVKINKDGNFDGRVGAGYLLSDKEFGGILDYVFNLCKNAIAEIESGFIKPSPLNINSKCECEHCEFKGMFPCFFALERKAQSISKEDFCLEGENNGK